MSYYRYGGILVNESTGNSIVADVPLKNLFNPSVGEVGFIEPSTGVVNPAQAQCYTTDFIPVEVGKTVAIGFIHKYVWNPTIISDFREYGRYTFFKADKKTVVNGGDFGYSETMHGVVVPSGASYIRASWATYGGSLYFYPVTDTWKCFVTCGDTLPTNPVPYKYNNSNVVELDSLPLFGKTLLVFGDSYSDSWGGHSWDAREITQADQGGTVENNVAWSGKLFGQKFVLNLVLPSITEQQAVLIFHMVHLPMKHITEWIRLKILSQRSETEQNHLNSLYYSMELTVGNHRLEQ